MSGLVWSLLQVMSSMINNCNHHHQRSSNNSSFLYASFLWTLWTINPLPCYSCVVDWLGLVFWCLLNVVIFQQVAPHVVSVNYWKLERIIKILLWDLRRVFLMNLLTIGYVVHARKLYTLVCERGRFSRSVGVEKSCCFGWMDVW